MPPLATVAALPRAIAAPAAPDGQMAFRQRSRVGSITINDRSFARQQSVSARVTSGATLIVVPLKGNVTAVGEGEPLAVEAGEIALLGRPQGAALVWSAGARGDLLTVRRDHLQICASRHFGEPRRLAATDKLLQQDEPFLEALAALKACRVSAKPAEDSLSTGFEADFHQAFVALAVRRGLADELFLDVRSAREAIAYIGTNHQRDCSPAALAAITGVTERTLRERFRQCLGVSIATFVQDVRLDWAHARLISARESRSISDLAKAAGFPTASGFSRSYLRRFGESATCTRMRAVRDAGES